MTMENKKGDQLGDQLGDKGDKASGRHTIQQRETRRETMGDKGRQGRTHHPTQAHMWGDNGRQGDKTSGRGTHHPTQAHMWGDNGRQGETRPREGGHTIQHRHTCGETMGDKGRQDLGKADTPSNTKLDTLRKH